MRSRLTKNERGAALVEAAITIPLILLIPVAIFEFGRAYQTWEVLTNAAREGARVAIISGTTDAEVRSAVNNYMSVGRPDRVRRQHRREPLGAARCEHRFADHRQVSVLVHGARTSDQAHQSVATAGAPLTMSAVSVMRNE